MDEFPPAELQKYPGLTEMLIEAAAKEQDWKTAMEYLKAAPESFDKIARLAWTSVVHEKAGDPAASEAAWREATIEAEVKTESGVWLNMASIMRSAGSRSRENESMYQAILRGKGRLPLFQDLRLLLEDFYAEGREKAIVQICAIYLLFEPGNPVILTHYSYLACVSGTGDPGVLAKAIQPLADAYPNLPQILCVLTTIHLFKEDFGEASRIAQLVTAPAESLPPGYRAALIAARVRGGLLSAESEEVRGIPWKSLMPSESRFFRRIIELKTPEKEGGNG